MVLEKVNIDQKSPIRTPTSRIELLYLLKPARDACIEIVGEDSRILAANWLLWLNQDSLLVESCLASLANLVPFLDQLSTEASSIIDNDTMSNSSLPVLSLKVDLPADDQDDSQYSASSSRSDSASTASELPGWQNWY